MTLTIYAAANISCRCLMSRGGGGMMNDLHNVDSWRWTDKACVTAVLNLVIIGVLRSDQIYYLLSICKTNNGYRTDSKVSHA